MTNCSLCKKHPQFAQIVLGEDERGLCIECVARAFHWDLDDPEDRERMTQWIRRNLRDHLFTCGSCGGSVWVAGSVLVRKDHGWVFECGQHRKRVTA